MINQIDIQNFQSHKQTTLSLHPGVNVVIGKSDSGKTAIIRALRYLIWNRPSGDAFCSSWGGDTVVTVETDDGNTITHKRIKSVSSYVINDSVFSAFGTGVPQEVQSLLNMSETNLQSQFDLPFLLTDSAGEVAAHFNKMAHIDQIDTSMKLVNSWIRELEQTYKHKKQTLDELDEQMRKYDVLPFLEADLEGLELLEKTVAQYGKQIGNLSQTITSIEHIQDEVEELKGLVELEDEVSDLLSLITNKEKIDEKKDTLKRTIISITSLSEKKEKLNKLVQCEALVDHISSLLQTKKEKEREIQTITDMIDKTNRIKNTIKVISSNTEEKEQLLYLEMPDICPLCDQSIPKQ